MLESTNYKTLRAFFYYLVNVEKLLEVNPVTGLATSPSYTHEVNEITVLSDKEIKHLINSLSDGCSLKCRTAVIILLMLDCGIHYSELSELKISSFNFNELEVTINGETRELDRTVKLSNSTVGYIKTYIDYKKSECEYLIIDKSSNKKITPSVVRKVINRLNQNFSFYVSGNVLRDTFAIKFLKSNANYHLLAYVLGIELRTAVARYKDYMRKENMKGMVDFAWID